MRNAKFDDFWKNVYRRPYAVVLKAIQFTAINGLGSGHMNLGHGIIAICGGNGVGKTTLLEAIAASLGRPIANFQAQENTRIAANLVSEGEEIVRCLPPIISEVEVLSEKPLSVIFLDPGVQTLKLYERIISIENISELIEPLSPVDAERQHLELISYLVGKHYTSIQSYEIEDFSSDPPFPYFRVTSDGITYGTESMGLGELSLHLLFWELKRLPTKSILLLEEPEAYISHKSQVALMDVLSKVCTENEISCILTTHSTGIIQHISPEHIRLMFRQAGKVTIVNEPTKADLSNVLGLERQYSGIVLLEDEVAVEFARTWLRYHGSTLLQDFALVNAGSEGEMQNALRHTPEMGPWFKVFGLYDGDMRSKVKKSKWPYGFLPSLNNPEELLRDAATAQPDRLASKLMIEETKFKLLLAELEGKDSHDWLTELQNRLCMPLESLLPNLFSHWIEQDGNEKIASEAYGEMLKVFQMGKT